MTSLGNYIYRNQASMLISNTNPALSVVVKITYFLGHIRDEIYTAVS